MNNDLISREALKKDFEERNKACDKWIAKAKDEETKIRADATKNFICEVIMTIDNAPTVEERPHGKWIEDSGNIACSHCHTIWLYRRTDYCPNCGAEMEVSNDG